MRLIGLQCSKSIAENVLKHVRLTLYVFFLKTTKQLQIDILHTKMIKDSADQIKTVLILICFSVYILREEQSIYLEL